MVLKTVLKVFNNRDTWFSDDSSAYCNDFSSRLEDASETSSRTENKCLIYQNTASWSTHYKNHKTSAHKVHKDK